MEIIIRNIDGKMTIASNITSPAEMNLLLDMAKAAVLRQQMEPPPMAPLAVPSPSLSRHLLHRG